MAKRTREQRKRDNIRRETQRRIDEGDRSKYVQSSAKQHGLSVPTRQTYNPNKVSHVIKETTGLTGRDAHLANQAFRSQTANNQRIQAQNAKRRAVEEAFHRQGNVNRSDFTGKVEGSGIFGTNIGAKYSGKPKLREGLTSDEYHDWMRNLYDINPSMMEQLFPWGSGKTARGIATLATPLKYLEKGANLFGNQLSNVGQGIKDALPEGIGFEANRFMQNLDGVKGRFWDDLQSMLGINQNPNQNLADVKTTQTTEDIISPAALSRTDSVEAPQYNDIFQPDERIFKLPLTEGNQKYKFRNQYFQPDAPWDEFGNYLMQNPQGKGQGLYATQMAHGGEIQDDAYARLKAINDSMHEM